jgi:hypothetical protein
VFMSKLFTRPTLHTPPLSIQFCLFFKSYPCNDSRNSMFAWKYIIKSHQSSQTCSQDS